MPEMRNDLVNKVQIILRDKGEKLWRRSRTPPCQIMVRAIKRRRPDLSKGIPDVMEVMVIISVLLLLGQFARLIFLRR